VRFRLKSADRVPIYLRIIYFSLITVLTFTILFPVRKIITEEIINQKKQVIELLESKIRHKISYDSISPSFLHAFEIRGLKISSFDAPYDDIIDISKVRLRFNIFKYSPINPLNAFIGLTIVDSDFSYDASKNDSIKEIISSLNTSSKPINAAGYSLPDNFTIKGKNLSLMYSTAELNIQLSSLFFTLGSSEEGDLTISSKTEAAINIGGLPAPSPVAGIGINTRMSLSGRLSPDISWADIEINSKDFSSNIFTIERIKWNLKYSSPGLFTLTKIGDNIPADLELSVNTSENSLAVDLNAQDFIFTKYFKEAEILKDYHLLLTSSMSGNAHAEFQFRTGDFLYDCGIKIENIQGLTEDPINITADFDGRNKKIKIYDSMLDTSIGTIAYQGIVELTDTLPLLNGKLELSDVILKNYKLAAGLNLNTDEDGNYIIAAESAVVNDLILKNISADILPYGDSFDFKLAAGIENKENRLDFINLEGNIQLGDDFFIQAAAYTEKLPIEPFLKLLPMNFNIPEILQDLRLTTSIFISGTTKEIAFASPLIKFEDENNRNKSLSFALSGNNSGFRISSINLDWLGNSLTGKISADLSANNDMIISSQFIYNNISFEPSGVFDNRGNVSLVGDYGLKFNLIKNFGSGYNINIVIDRFPLRLNAEEPSYLNIDAMAVYNSFDDWNLLVKNFYLEQLPVPAGEGAIGASILLSEDGGSIYNLTYTDSFSKLSGQASLLISELSPNPSGRLQLSADNPDQNEYYDLILLLEKDRLEGSLSFDNLPVSRFSANLPLDGYINGELSIRGSADSPKINLALNSKGMKLNKEPVNFTAAINYSDLSVVIDNISGNSRDIVFNDISGNLDLKKGIHSINGSLEMEKRFLSMIADFSGQAETAPIASIKDIKNITSEDFTARLDLTKLLFNDENKDLWGIKFWKDNNVLSLSGGPGYSINGSLYEDGFFTLGSDSPSPINFEASGTLESGNINANITDITYIFEDLEIPFFHIYEGSITGGLRIIGSLNDPDLFGQINLNDLIFKPPIVEDITEKFSTSIFFREKTVTMPSTRVPTNNGMVFITIDAVMERWLPRSYNLELRVPEGQSISAMFYKPPFYIYGFAEGNLRIYGDLVTMRVDGDLNIINSIMVLNNNLEAKSMFRPTERLLSELRITTGENNQLFWPTREVPIVNGFLGSNDNFTLTFDSGQTGFNLDGELSLKGGEVFYFEKNFYIKEGSLKFINNAEDSVDPLLSTRAEIRDVNADGELTRIYLIVDESPLSQFAPRFESEPALSTVEILSILGGNFMESIGSGSNFDYRDALLTVGDLFTQFTILKGIEDTLKSTLGLDLLSIRSSFLTNIVEDKFISFSGGSNITNFAKYLDNTTLFLGKYFTDDIFIQGLFQFDLYNNSGYSEGLNIDSEVKLEWEGPVANLELSFFPDFIDPVQGLNKTSVGLSWRFSY